MARTAHLDLPLLAPAQAQKHVTVNEALVRLDAIVNLNVASSVIAVPPDGAAEGQSYLVPPGATGEWSGHENQITVWSNGGWIFLLPKVGWRVWDTALSSAAVFDGQGWNANAVAVSPSGGGISMRALEFQHVIKPGKTNITEVKIPKNAQVIGLTGRVEEALKGSGLTTWKVGITGSDNRYGSGLGKDKNSYILGLGSYPFAYYDSTPLILTVEAGSFLSGKIRFVLNIIEIFPIRSF